MNIREQLHKIRYGPICNEGGDSGSDASTKTETQTSTTVSTTDKRAVASDYADAISGNNNRTSKTFNVVTTDYGSVGAALSGNTQIAARAVDLGQFAIGGAIDAMKAQSSDNAKTIGSVFDLANTTSANALTNNRDVLGFAAKETAQNVGLVSSVMDLASTFGRAVQATADGATNTVAAAYKNSSDANTGNRTVLLAALAVVGVVGAAVMFKKA